MLEPVQRIPRYRLLLADYLKYLPPDSHDRPDTESEYHVTLSVTKILAQHNSTLHMHTHLLAEALKLISEAADRTNNRIKELENSSEILSIQRSITDFEGTLLIPSRIFLKKGQLQKFSRKTLTPRMFFLVSKVTRCVCVCVITLSLSLFSSQIFCCTHNLRAQMSSNLEMKCPYLECRYYIHYNF